MIALKKDFVVFFNNYLCIPDKGGSIKEDPGFLDWRLLPAELRPKKKIAKKRSNAPATGANKKTKFDLSL